jgi:hypothetical protein
MSDQIRSSRGIVSVKDKRITLELDSDFIRYYHYFIERKYWVTLHRPLYGAHITIATDKFYKDVDWKKAEKYRGEVINFNYSVDMIHGGRTKGFHMFYLKVFSDRIDEIKRDIGAIDNATYKGLHVTIAQAGKGNSQIKLWYPQLIKIGN